MEHVHDMETDLNLIPLTSRDLSGGAYHLHPTAEVGLWSGVCVCGGWGKGCVLGQDIAS